MKKILCVLLIIFAAGLYLSCRKLNPIIPKDVTCVPCGNKYVFHDAAVRQAVSSSLSKMNCDICVSDLATLSYLTINSQINDFSDFQNLPNILELTLTNVTIPDFNFASGLPLMHKLTITGGTVQSLQGIGGAASLKELSIVSSKVTDITPLTATALAAMDKLTLTNNYITSLVPLAGMTNLTSLNVSSNKLDSLAGIENMAYLTALDASSNTINDISAISSLINLKTVNLNSNKITDIGDMALLTNVTDLRVAFNTGPLDISILQAFTLLTNVELAYDGITDITPLVNNPGIVANVRVYIASDSTVMNNNTDLCVLKCRLVNVDNVTINQALCNGFICP